MTGSDLMRDMPDAEYSARQPGAYDQGRYAIALRMLGDVAGKRAFDFHCGEGSFMRKLRAAGAIVSGCEASEKLARQSDAMVGGVEILEQQSDLDIVVALNVTSFISKSERDRLWPAVHAALNPGGLFLHFVTNTWTSQQTREFGADPRTFPQFLKTHRLIEIDQDFYGYRPSRPTRAVKRAWHGMRHMGETNPPEFDPRVFALWKLALIPWVLKRRRCTGYFSLSCKV